MTYTCFYLAKICTDYLQGCDDYLDVEYLGYNQCFLSVAINLFRGIWVILGEGGYSVQNILLECAANMGSKNKPLGIPMIRDNETWYLNFVDFQNFSKFKPKLARAQN